MNNWLHFHKVPAACISGSSLHFSTIFSICKAHTVTVFLSVTPDVTQLNLLVQVFFSFFIELVCSESSLELGLKASILYLALILLLRDKCGWIQLCNVSMMPAVACFPSFFLVLSSRNQAGQLLHWLSCVLPTWAVFFASSPNLGERSTDASHVASIFCRKLVNFSLLSIY